jgi:phytanoyl-CoA hydroxylase
MSWRDSAEQLPELFNRDGYVAIRGFYDAAQMAELHEQIDRFIRDVVPTLPPEHVFYENKSDKATLKQLQQIGAHDAWFGDLFDNGPFREVAEILLNDKVVPKNMQYFNKPAQVGQPTPPHQDGYYFMLDPCEAVTMWFALEDVDEENGCVRYLPGSHKLGMREHDRTETLGFSQGITDFGTVDDLANEIACPAKPGDLFVHHALTIHRADGNRSPNRSRRALGFIYYGQRAKEDVAAHEAYQKKLAEEMATAGKI